MAFDARSAKALAAGNHLTVHEAPGLRLTASHCGQVRSGLHVLLKGKAPPIAEPPAARAGSTVVFALVLATQAAGRFGLHLQAFEDDRFAALLAYPVAACLHAGQGGLHQCQFAQIARLLGVVGVELLQAGGDILAVAHVGGGTAGQRPARGLGLLHLALQRCPATGQRVVQGVELGWGEEGVGHAGSPGMPPSDHFAQYRHLRLRNGRLGAVRRMGLMTDEAAPSLAMVLRGPRQALAAERRPLPLPGPGEVRLRVRACAVCRTDLHLQDGELPMARWPVVPGHEVVGVVDALGDGVHTLALGQRVGVPWLGRSCGHCRYCLGGQENLCDDPQFTGCTRDGGFAAYTVADAAFCVPLEGLSGDDALVAPLLCAGLIGWRCLRAAGAEARVLGLYGFGAAAHLVAQIAIAQGRRVHAFTRPGDAAAQALARALGCAWAGGSDEAPPEPLDAAILFAPVGALVPCALAAVRKGGRVVCGGIHMSDIPSFPYALLWQERQLVSVANLTRDDARGFFAAAAKLALDVHVERYALSDADRAMQDLRDGRVQGAAVLVVPDSA